MILLIIFVLGLIFGSFLNAVIYRLHQGISWLVGRSRCPHCHHDLAPLDLIPVVSWLLLAGHCRYCHKPISWQYPLVELVTAGAMILIYFRLAELYYGDPATTLRFWLYVAFTLFLIVIFVYDLKHYLILDSVVLPAMIVALIGNLLLGANLFGLGLAALIAGGFFWLQYVVSRGAWIGGGDIRLGVLMGLMLPWPNILAALFLAYFIGSIIGLGLIFSRAKQMKSQVPFGTFLTVGTFITLLYGADLIHWYQGLYL